MFEATLQSPRSGLDRLQVAAVVGLMCLRVFCAESPLLYEKLVPSAKSLGAAFQKVNFLRDIKDDYKLRGRTYFPNVDFGDTLTQEAKSTIENDIRQDFANAYVGIIQLPKSSRKGVMLAYHFFLNLFEKICRTPPKAIMHHRIRISNYEKLRIAIPTIMFR